MSEASPDQRKSFGGAIAQSIISGMGPYMAIWMAGRTALLQKVVDQMKVETNPKKLKKLKQMSDSMLFDEEDIKRMKKRFLKALEATQEFEKKLKKGKKA